MDKLTLTGASLVDSKKNDTVVETTGGHNHGGHDHGGHDHGGHDHGHSHSHGGGGCCAPKEPAVRVVYTPPSDEEIMNASPEDIRTSLCTLIRMGAFKEAFEPLLTLVLEKRPNADAEILNAIGNDHYSLLHWAAKRVDDARFIQLLCEKMKPELINLPSTDNVAMRPLHWAATEGGLPHAAILLKFGADIEGTDGSGCTPLLIAAQYGHVDVVAFLLQRKANGTAVDQNRDSALHWAAYKGSIQVCGHLLFRGELSWTSQDAYGQTPLHLAALRGNTSVVRYLLQEGTKQEATRVLNMADKNHKTPLDLAISKKKPTVEMVLREHQQLYDKKWGKRTKSALAQLCSYRNWQLWMGCAMASDNDVTPKFPLYFMMSHMLAYTLWYPFIFTPVFNTSSGIMWDYSGFHLFNILSLVLMWFCHYKVRTTDPGKMTESNPETAKYRKMYEETIESFSDEANAKRSKGQLCHTCHIVRPTRSKHCRDARRCVLLFDHHCPFVGNTVGLYNYKWFYLTLFFLTICNIGFGVTLWIYLHRQFSWTLCIFGIYLCLFILFGGGMLLYHTQLSMVNLTTNEHINVSRYTYLQNERGKYKNPFFKGWLNNFLERFFPSSASYTLPTQQEPLLRGENAV